MGMVEGEREEREAGGQGLLAAEQRKSTAWPWSGVVDCLSFYSFLCFLHVFRTLWAAGAQGQPMHRAQWGCSTGDWAAWEGSPCLLAEVGSDDANAGTCAQSETVPVHLLMGTGLHWRLGWGWWTVFLALAGSCHLGVYSRRDTHLSQCMQQWATTAGLAPSPWGGWVLSRRPPRC